MGALVIRDYRKIVSALATELEKALHLVRTQHFFRGKYEYSKLLQRQASIFCANE